MELIIKSMNGDTETVIVNPCATIRELKIQIAQRFTLSPSQVELFVQNGQTEKLDNEQKAVRDYQLSSGSVILLKKIPFQVFVKNEKGQTKTYDITENETVDQLMTKVRQKEGIVGDQQRLLYNGKQLESGRRLQDYNIRCGDSIQMTLRLRGG